MWARTLWRVGRHALLAVASPWSEESLSLSLTCRSFLGRWPSRLLVLSPPFHSFVSCPARTMRTSEITRAQWIVLRRCLLNSHHAVGSYISIGESEGKYSIVDSRNGYQLVNVSRYQPYSTYHTLCRWIIRPYNLSLGLMPIYMYLWLRPEIRHCRIWRLVQNKKSVF